MSYRGMEARLAEPKNNKDKNPEIGDMAESKCPNTLNLTRWKSHATRLQRRTTTLLETATMGITLVVPESAMCKSKSRGRGADVKHSER